MCVLDDLLSEASKLPEDQKLTLAHRLLASVEPSVSEQVEQAWDLEIRERIARFDRGEACTRPAGEVFSDLDRLLRR
jgi:hypothetical protein